MNAHGYARLTGQGCDQYPMDAPRLWRNIQISRIYSVLVGQNSEPHAQ